MRYIWWSSVFGQTHPLTVVKVDKGHITGEANLDRPSNLFMHTIAYPTCSLFWYSIWSIYSKHSIYSIYPIHSIGFIYSIYPFHLSILSVLSVLSILSIINSMFSICSIRYILFCSILFYSILCFVFYSIDAILSILSDFIPDPILFSSIPNPMPSLFAFFSFLFVLF